MSSLPTTRKNVALVELATALASSVLPVPGSPYRMTPWRGRGWVGGVWVGAGAELGRERRGRAWCSPARDQQPSPACLTPPQPCPAFLPSHLWRLDTDVLVQLGVSQRQLHGLLDFLNLRLQPADVGVGLGGRVLHLHDADCRVGLVAEDTHH
jgi:hypothetical protein